MSGEKEQVPGGERERQSRELLEFKQSFFVTWFLIALLAPVVFFSVLEM